MPDGPRRRMAMLLIREILLILCGAFVGYVLFTPAITNRAGQREEAMAFGVMAGAFSGLTIHFVLPRK